MNKRQRRALRDWVTAEEKMTPWPGNPWAAIEMNLARLNFCVREKIKGPMALIICLDQSVAEVGRQILLNTKPRSPGDDLLLQRLTPSRSIPRSTVMLMCVLEPGKYERSLLALLGKMAHDTRLSAKARKGMQKRRKRLLKNVNFDVIDMLADLSR